MKLTGTKIREAISIWTVRKEAAEKTFKDSLMAFSDEQKNPAREATALQVAELSIAHLQALQSLYNTRVLAEALSESRTLGFWVKALGVYERETALWKGALSAGERQRTWGGEPSGVRKKDEEWPHPTMKPADIAKEATAAMRRATEIRSAIARANQKEIELDVEASYFE